MDLVAELRSDMGRHGVTVGDLENALRHLEEL